MPFEKPGSLSRQQSADLLAYMLQAGKFPAGAVELGEGVLAQIAFPTRERAARLPAGAFRRRKATSPS